MRTKGVVLGIVLLLITSAVIFAEDGTASKKLAWTKDTTVLDLFGIGLLKPNINEKGQIVGLQGFNILLGYRWKNYFEPLELQKITFFWDVGFVFLIPYAGVGLDYPIDQKFYLSAGFMVTPFIIFLVPPAPYVTLGITF
ncbi:hypothetical protein [Fervidobacterium thailandense]|uniref:Uncharacterized protein n=1 Tax=Fervidobacterium thailandense TaxID=1008305 RepID=A0A1E3G1U6_9BACT|nr:hypothetical protein [Fervidobacterium thailandense]ODN30120.1 hypothetical protein A4H02_07405 [Fervidobacterium thailandense]